MLTTLLKRRTRGATGAAARSPYSRPVSTLVVRPGQVSTRGAISQDFTIRDGGTVDNRQQPGVALNRRWPSQATINTRQISYPPAYTNRWETPPAPPRINSTGFLLALQVNPGPLPPKPKPKDEYDTFYGPSASPFPTQYLGLKCYFQGAVQDLCLVAVADAPTGMGVFKVHKGGTDYAVYIVETADPNASPVRVGTSGGTKAVRLKT